MKERKLLLMFDLPNDFLFFSFDTLSRSCFLFRFYLVCYLPFKKIFEWFSLVFVKKWEILQRLHLLPWPWSWIAVTRSFTWYILLHLFTEERHF